MSKYHVAIVHDTPIPALKYGGTERLIWWLGQALTSLGHKVTYVVPKGSTCPFADLILRPERNSKVNDLIPEDADIVHSFATLSEEITKPLIVTIGGNGQVGEKYHPNTVFVSKNHAERHDSKAFVHNGINPDEYPAYDSSVKENFCYFLAKASWSVKNVKGCIKIAKKANVPIHIMGGYRLSLNRNVKWLGMIGGEKKLDTLKRGSALLFPVRWNEPFGLAIVEAFLTGSPVFGTPYGSLPELVTKDVGVLSNNSHELAEALKNMNRYDRDSLRKYALDNFTHIHMAEKYLNYYEHIISGKKISESEPRTLTKTPPQTLLDFS